MVRQNGASLLLIALDAAEPNLVEQWMNRGLLPNLRLLRSNGSFCRLASTADWLAGSPWPTFYAGTTPEEHGLYHSMQWRADEMRIARPTPCRLPIRPFWLDLVMDRKIRFVAMDLPMKYPPEPFNGSEINNWATHDQMGPPSSIPSSLLKWVTQEFGAPPLPNEVWGPQRVRELLDLRDQLVHATQVVARVAEALMKREEWNVFMISFGAAHRGGHKLLDLSSTWGPVGSRDRARFSTALQDVYVACDTAVGQLVRAVGDRVTVLIFSLHGMRPNTSRSHILPIALSRILCNTSKYSGQYRTQGFSQRLSGLRELVPLAWRYATMRKLPMSLQKRLVERQPGDRAQWKRSPVISLPSDLQGYIRINLRGRESEGIVEPGEDYDEMCSVIGEGLLTFVDADTNRPIVEKVMRRKNLFPQGLHADELPDLIVKWASSPASNHRAIVSSKYGPIPWSGRGHNPDGRSGNHGPEGFLIATGDNIRSNSHMRNAHILDLAPTMLALLNEPKPHYMPGNVLPLAK